MHIGGLGKWRHEGGCSFRAPDFRKILGHEPKTKQLIQMKTYISKNRLVRLGLTLGAGLATFIPTMASTVENSLLSLGAKMPLAAEVMALKADDFVGVSFWLISMALVAATVFFFMETQRVSNKWKTSLTVSGLVTMVALDHFGALARLAGL